MPPIIARLTSQHILKLGLNELGTFSINVILMPVLGSSDDILGMKIALENYAFPYMLNRE